MIAAYTTQPAVFIKHILCDENHFYRYITASLTDHSRKARDQTKQHMSTILWHKHKLTGVLMSALLLSSIKLFGKILRC